jgi:hypothetical protein
MAATSPQAASTQSKPAAPRVPAFQWDHTWPRELPNNWLVGNVVGVAVDSRDNVWIVHRPNSQTGAEKTPAVLAFDQSGNLVRNWGAPGAGYDWGTQTHGLYVDSQDNVWVGFGGGLPYDLKSRATTDAKADEVYFSDGYTNRRVIVFDVNTGAYKRHWGAFGKPPDDTPMPAFNRSGPPRQQFDTPHCLAIANDGFVYVCDRGNQRIQVFRKDGTFVKDAMINAKLTEGVVGGTPWDIAFSTDPAQAHIFLADGGNHRVHTLRRESLEVVSTFGRRGRWGGQFESPHSLAIDSKGNLFVAETLDGRRVQKFVPR